MPCMSMPTQIPGSGVAPIFLGAAAYGVARNDVAALFGSRFTNAGYSHAVNGLAPVLPPGGLQP